MKTPETETKKETNQDFSQDKEKDPDPKKEDQDIVKMIQKMYEKMDQISEENQMIKQRFSQMNPWGQMVYTQPSWGTSGGSPHQTRPASWNI